MYASLSVDRLHCGVHEVVSMSVEQFHSGRNTVVNYSILHSLAPLALSRATTSPFPYLLAMDSAVFPNYTT